MNNPTPNRQKDQMQPPKPGVDQKTKGSSHKSDSKKDIDSDQTKEKETGERNPYPDAH